MVAASNLGSDRHPDWYLNLVAEPRVTVQVKSDRFQAAGSVVSGHERDRLWDVMTGIWPDYADYQRRTERRIPVVVLDTTDENTSASPRA